jgi:hypothetical protein
MLKTSFLVLAIFGAVLIIYHLAGNVSHIESMLLGMGMGAASAGPMMYYIKRIRLRIRERCSLKELAEIMNKRKESETSELSE